MSNLVIKHAKTGVNPEFFMKPNDLPGEDIEDAKQVFSHYAGTDGYRLEAMLRVYKDMRTGLLRHTAAYNADLCLNHDDAIAEAVEAYGCSHKWDNTTIRRSSNSVLGTSTVYRVDTCSTCGEKRESVQHNQSQTGD